VRFGNGSLVTVWSPIDHGCPRRTPRATRPGCAQRPMCTTSSLPALVSSCTVVRPTPSRCATCGIVSKSRRPLWFVLMPLISAPDDRKATRNLT
jgi:hypothetical protein